MSRTLIMAPEQAARTLRRLAFEVIERNRGADNLSIVGIRRRGSALAEALAAQIASIEGGDFPVSRLDVTPYRDDRDREAGGEDQSAVHGSFDERDVLLIDDVLFTGRTARAALDAVVRYGRPRSIQLIVLIDRGHREYPIQPDYVGLLLQTKHKERVTLEVEDGFQVVVED